MKNELFVFIGIVMMLLSGFAVFICFNEINRLEKRKRELKKSGIYGWGLQMLENTLKEYYIKIAVCFTFFIAFSLTVIQYL